MNKLIVSLSVLLVGFSACKKQEVVVSAKPKYSSSVEITVPVYKIPAAFCPAALQLGADREIMQRLENELSDDGTGRKYIHCHKCDTGVFRTTEDGDSACSYCGAKQ